MVHRYLIKFFESYNFFIINSFSLFSICWRGDHSISIYAKFYYFFLNNIFPVSFSNSKIFNCLKTLNNNLSFFEDKFGSVNEHPQWGKPFSLKKTLNRTLPVRLDEILVYSRYKIKQIYLRYPSRRLKNYRKVHGIQG